jgi:replicative DNA helicase
MAESREYPRNLAAERAVLGAMLLDRDALHEGFEKLTPEHLFLPSHREIYAGLVDLWKDQTEVDPLTLAEVLKRRGVLEAVGGLPYLLSLVEDITTVAAFSHHLRLVLDKHLLRSLINVSVEIAERASTERSDADALLDEAEARVFGIAAGRIRRDFVQVGEVVGGVFDDIERFSRDRDYGAALKTGYNDVDELLGGLHRQNLIIIAARPGVGKTAFALNVCQNLAVNADPVPVAVFSLEMSKEALAQRLLCSVARADLAAVRQGRVGSQTWPNLVNAVNALTPAPIYIDDSPDLNILEIRAKARRIKARRDVQLVIVDYLQMVHGHGRYENRQTEIAAVSQFLKSLSKELDIPVVACAQLSRAVERRMSGEPQLSDLRESGAIEQDADVVIFLHPQSAERDDAGPDPEYQETDVIVAKQRNGPTGKVGLVFARKYTHFELKTRRVETRPQPAADAAEAF